jgi:hypothetical protein
MPSGLGFDPQSSQPFCSVFIQIWHHSWASARFLQVLSVAGGQQAVTDAATSDPAHSAGSDPVSKSSPIPFLYFIFF